MKRVVATLRTDAMVQFRSGFYYVGVAVALFYVGLLRLLPEDGRINFALLIPAALVLNVMISTFYFVAALVLLERSEGTLGAQIVTPLRVHEYLAAKVMTLTFLALIENGLVLLLFYGLRFDPATLLAGTVLLCALYTLVGLATAARYESINQLLMPSIVVVTALVLPLLDHFGAVGAPVRLAFYAHPVQPALMLMRSAFTAGPITDTVFGLVAGGAWVGVGYLLARRAFRRLALSVS